MQKTGEIVQNQIRQKKSTNSLFVEIKTELGVKDLAKKLGIAPRTLHSYKNFLRDGKKTTKNDRIPPKEILKKIKEISKTTKVKVYKQVTKNNISKKVFTGKYEKLKPTEKVFKTYLKGTGTNVLHKTAINGISKALKQKDFKYFFVRVHLEYEVKNLGKMNQWYSFAVMGKTIKKVNQQITDFIDNKKSMASIMYFKILELNLDIISK